MFLKKVIYARKKASQQRSAATVDAILTATAQIFSKMGFNETSTNLIAERAGVSIGSLYQYFPNKESLAAALVDRLVRRHSAVLQEKVISMRSLPLPEFSRAISDEFLKVFIKNRKLMKTVGLLITGLDQVPVVLETRGQFVRFFASELKARSHEITHPDLEAAAYFLVNGSMGVIQMYLFEDPPSLSKDQMQEELGRLMIRYLTGKH